MALFKKDDVVKLKMVVPSGAVQKMAMDDDGKVSCLLER